MRVRIRHDATFHYDPPARSVTKVLRLEPRNHEGQHITGWRITADVDCRLKPGEDAFGNFTHSFAVRGTIESVVLSVECEIETFGTAGVARGTVERFPPEFYLRTTDLTQPSPELRDFATAATAGSANELEKLHDLLAATSRDLGWAEKLSVASRAAGPVLAARKGCAAELAHVFISAARHLNIPARFVAGYHLEAQDPQDPSHCWAEAYVGGLGWVGFDPALGNCPIEAHVRLACGLDHLSAIPVRSAHVGPADEAVSVKITVGEPRFAS